MKSHNISASLIAFALLSLPLHAQIKRNFSMPTYTPAPSRPAQTQYSAPAQHSSPPQRQTSSQPAYSTPQQQSSPARTYPTPQQQNSPGGGYSAPQRQTPQSTPQRPAPSYSTPSQRSNQGSPESSSNNTANQGREQQQQRAEQQSHQKEEARQQKEAAKLQQQQRKEEARQQKQAMKQQRAQQKEQARLQKNSLKPANEPKQISDTPRSINPARPAQINTASTYHVPEGTVIGKSPSGSTMLSRDGSHVVIQQVNLTRLHLSGVNGKPIPEGNVTVHGNGRLTVSASGRRQYGIRPDGTISSYRDSTKTVSFSHSGKVSSLRTSNIEILRGANGQRTVISRRANNARLISTGAHSGYLERNVVVGNQTLIQRTTVINDRIVTQHYVGFTYGGVAMARFVTPVFYTPAFYGWAFYPWVTPMHFAFGWLGAPWYVGPNPYFVAYPVYPGAAFWLTDYMIGETLAAAYEIHAEAGLATTDNYAGDADDSRIAADDDEDSGDTVSAVTTTPITPELKSAIAEEVKQELSYDSAASNANTQETGYDEVNSILGSPHHVFLVSGDLEATTTDEQTCNLQAGDILQLEAPPTEGSALAELRVASGKVMDCPAGVTVTLAVSDLQEMHNNFRAQVEAGLGKLQAEQGQGGIPVAPPVTVAAPPKPTLVGVETVPPAQVNAMLDAERQQANQAEAEAAEAF